MKPEKKYQEGMPGMQLNLKNDVKRLVIICIAALIAAFNIRVFVNPAGLFPAGLSGLALLIQDAAAKYLGWRLPYSILNIALNAVPIWVGFHYIGKKFTILSVVYIVLTSVLTDVLPDVQMTDNVLLLTVYGSIVGGFAASMCLNADATGGGADFISIFYAERGTMNLFTVIFRCNLVMLVLSGLLFSWERAMYSIIYQYVCSQVVGQLYGRYQKQTLFIVTYKPREVYEIIRDTTHHAATLFRGEGLYANEERCMLYSVVSRDEAAEVIRRVKEADDHAFINSLQTHALAGAFYLKPKD